MAVADILLALNGYYTPTGMYSFEFRNAQGNSITEVFFVLPPGSVTVSESQRSDLIPTLKGGYLVDFGNEFKDIQVQGQSHFFYVGSTKNPAGETDNSANANTENYIDGYSEFIKLRFMVSRYRDYTMTKNGKLMNAPALSLKGLAQTKALKKFVTDQIKNKEGALADKLEVIWHDYDYDDHFKIKVDNLSITRDKSDPWTVQYNMSLKAYEVDDKASRIKPFSLENQRQSVAQLMQSVDNLTANSHEQSIPDTITVNNGQSTIIVTNQAVSQVA